MQPHRDADGSLKRARDDGGQARLLHDAECRGDSAERLGLDHEQVGSARPSDLERIRRLAHRLIGGDGQSHVLDASAQLRKLRHGRTGLLEVLEVVRGEGVNRVLRLVDVPAAVGVDADATLRPEDGARLCDPGHVIRQHLAGFGYLHLHCAAAGEARKHGGHLARADGGQRGIHGDAAA